MTITKRITMLLACSAAALAVSSQPALALPDCDAIPTPPRCADDWVPPPGGTQWTKTYRFQPLTLSVIETQDSGPHELKIAFSATHPWGPYSVNNGDVVDLSYLTEWRFSDFSQSMTLTDVDTGEWLDGGDDQIGLHVVSPTTDSSVRWATFTESGAYYRLSYRVFYEGCQPITAPCPA